MVSTTRNMMRPRVPVVGMVEICSPDVRWLITVLFHPPANILKLGVGIGCHLLRDSGEQLRRLLVVVYPIIYQGYVRSNLVVVCGLSNTIRLRNHRVVPHDGGSLEEPVPERHVTEMDACFVKLGHQWHVLAAEDGLPFGQTFFFVISVFLLQTSRTCVQSLMCLERTPSPRLYNGSSQPQFNDITLALLLATLNTDLLLRHQYRQLILNIKHIPL
ncbi:hypothetical protein MLD38_004265 [Melastoma candidum]|uniref:Uncharacterized protein n=1 Tax=Melastoma candidum TaxID=119954 RepID=A0ACB9S5B3_9MYRT|nr:hypothetical protein MLD38_004265 [Melastoma candidum]